MGQGRAQDQYMVDTLTREHKRWETEFHRTVKEAKQEILQFYLRERASLLNNLKIIFAQSSYG